MENAKMTRLAMILTRPVVVALVVCWCGPKNARGQQPESPTALPVYILINNHVEGDHGMLEGDPACSALIYQTASLPPPGPGWPGPSFALDISGTELIRQILDGYHDSIGATARMLICPAGEFWQTEADATYGGRLFDVYDYQALGDEFGIQGHGIYYSGQSFCWYLSEHTAQGIAMKLTDLHQAAHTVTPQGQAVNGGLTLTGGAKLEWPTLGVPLAEWLIDHVAFDLGYRISYEDYDGHVEDEPPGVNNQRCCFYLYRADYGDGVRMLKIDMNGSLTESCGGATPRCETSAEAIARLDATLAARAADPNPRRVYYLAFAIHAGAIWTDFNRAAAGLPMVGEGQALLTFMDALQARVDAGAPVRFVTPAQLGALYVAPGDLDGDGDVDLNDFATFSGCFGLFAPAPPACPGDAFAGSDLDGNGAVDLNDFAALANNFTG
jgi:hypothetical protein